MTSDDLQLLIAQRLEDLADQIERLYAAEQWLEAEVLRESGLELAQTWDSGEEFMFLGDLSEV